MAERTIMWTWQDAVEQLLDQYDVVVDDRNRRLARQATLRAYRDLPNKTRWGYLERRTTLKTSASQSTGTVVYDHTGGAYERVLTLTGATWPTDADFGRVIISDVHYKVATYESTTEITLDAINNPGADVASTTYQWYRSAYPLPINFRKMGSIYDVDNEHKIALVGTDTHHAASIHFYDTPDTPWQASIRNQGEYYNTMAIEFGPPPSTSREYDFIYESAPRPLEIENYNTGTVDITSGTAAVTGTATVFPTNCVGSIMRLSADGVSAPTSPIGSPLPDGGGTDNLYAEQKSIIARASDTAVTLDSGVSSTLTGVKYSISDPIDLEVSAMFTAFYRLAEAEFARLIRDKMASQKMLDARQAMIEAMEADQRYTYSQGGVRYSRFSRVNVSTDSG